jgi:septum formation protein
MLWRGERPLVLASQSRARGMLLSNAGLMFEAIPAEIDERAIQKASGLNGPAEVAMKLAAEKARAVAVRHPDRIVVGADQTLAQRDRLFDKPADRDAAREQIRLLAGKTHELHSAFAVAIEGEIATTQVAVARMTVRALDDGAIDRYLDAVGDAAMTSVGAYQLEGLGVHLFERIEGDHFTILGLPLLQLLAFLRDRDLISI